MRSRRGTLPQPATHHLPWSHEARAVQCRASLRYQEDDTFMRLASPTTTDSTDPASRARRARRPRPPHGAARKPAGARALAAAASVLVLVAAAPAPALMSYQDFALPAGTNPQGLAASDCDGDGRPDLVAANMGDDTVTIYHNDGGTLVVAKTVHGPSQPAGAVCADFNEDGFVDLAVTSFATGTVTVYLGDADGELTAGAAFVVGQAPRSVSAADFDRDGHLDLLVVNARSSGLSLLFGDGAGRFPFGSTIRLPASEHSRSRPLSAAIGDYDHNGRPDIAIIGQGSPPLRILLGEGLGFSVDDQKLPATANPRSAASADLDLDGYADLAVLSTDATVRLYRGAAAQRFVSPDLLLLGGDARALALADFDGDALPDLAVSYAKSNTVRVLPAVAPGRFRVTRAASPVVVNGSNNLTQRSSDEVVAIDKAARTLARMKLNDQSALSVNELVPLGGPPDTLVLTDLDGDGTSDAVVALRTSSGPVLQVRLGNAAGGFNPPATGSSRCGNGVVEGAELCDDGNTAAGDGCGPTCTPEIARAAVSAAAADVDGDGRQDVVLTDARGTLLALLGNGTGGFREVRKLGAVRPRTPIAIAPFLGDGPPDIVFMPPRGAHALGLLANDGSGHFSSQLLPRTDQLRGPFAAADIDRNGFVDLVATVHSGAGFVVLFNDGDGPLRSGAIVNAPASLRGIDVADVDEDGWLDLFAFFGHGKSAPLLYLASPNGVFNRGAVTVAPDGRANAVLTDLNEDQHQDVVQCDGGAASSCSVAYGDGRGRFSATPPLDVSAQTGAYVGRLTRAATAADFDGDHVVDFAGVSRRDNRVVVFYRQADGANATRLELTTGSKPIAIAAADLDGDGRPDLVAANEGSTDLSVFLNRGARQFASLARVTLDNGGFKPSALAVGDLNGDGRPDLAVASADGSNVTLMLNRGSGGLVRGPSLATGASPQAVALGDLNGDGILDVVTANGGDDSVSLLLSDGAGGYQTRSMASGGMHPTDLAIADLDGDGAADLVVVNEVSRSLATFLNDGSGDLVFADALAMPGRKRPWNLCTGDFDGDGAADVAVASLGTADVTVIRGTGDGAWSGDVRVFSIGEDPRPLFCTDVDGDGRSDVLFVRRRTGRVDAIVTGR